MDANLKVIVSAVDMASSVLSYIPKKIISAFSEAQELVEKLKGSFLFEGAEYDEARGQFLAIADAYGIAGKSIEKTIDEIGEYQLSFAERTRIATKAVASGLQGEDLTQALTAVKRWSEATKQEFSGAAESIFGAFASGRFAGLKAQFGLVVKDGATVTDVLTALKNQMGLTADTGANFADVVETVGGVLSRIPTLLGSIIDRSPTLRSAFDLIAKSASDFASGFEDSVPILAGVFEFIIQAGIKVYDAIVDTFGGSFKFISDTFAAISKSEVLKDPFLAIIKGSEEAGKFVGEFAKNIALNFAPVVDVIGNVAIIFGDTYSSFKYYGLQMASTAEFLLSKLYEVYGKMADVGAWLAGKLGGVWTTISDNAIKAVSAMAQSMAEFAASSPEIASVMGLDTISAGLGALQTSLIKSKMDLKAYALEASNEYKGLAAAAGGLSQELSDAAQKVLTEGNIGNSLASQGQKIRDFAKTIDGSGMKAAAEKAVAAINGMKFKEIDLFPVGESRDAAKKAAQSIADERNRIMKEADDKALEQQVNAQKKQQDEIKKQLKEEKSLLEQSLKDIADIEKKKAGLTFGQFLTADEASLLAQKENIKKVLSEIENEWSKGRIKSGLDLTKAIKDIGIKEYVKDFVDGSKPVVEALNSAKNGELKMRLEQPKRQLIDVKVSGVNAPSWLQGLIDEILTQLVRAVKSERIPLVLTSYPAA